MNMPREKAIIFLGGHFCGITQSYQDLKIAIDQFLIFHNYPPMTKEESNFILEVYDEMWLMLKSDGLNRKDFRKMRNKGK